MTSWTNDAALGQQLLNGAVGQTIAQVAADRQRDHPPRKRKPAKPKTCPTTSPDQSASALRSTNATVPFGAPGPVTVLRFTLEAVPDGRRDRRKTLRRGSLADWVHHADWPLLVPGVDITSQLILSWRPADRTA